MNLKENISRDILLGVAVGDALGVPVEFISREELTAWPVMKMTGYGTYNLPSGTFSDDSSLTFCLAEVLTAPFNLKKLADNFIAWYRRDFWTYGGAVFDIGMATKIAIQRLETGMLPELAGGDKENDNGNGSLMRILPLLVLIKDMPVEDRFMFTRQVSSLTHRHIRSVIACFYYLEFAREILSGCTPQEAYRQSALGVKAYLASTGTDPIEIGYFRRLMENDICELEEKEIKSTGYVIDTLEASIWCLLNTGSYQEAVLKAVNLGEDSDTTAAITGGLAALVYGSNSIPAVWLDALARRRDIENLADRMNDFLR